MRLRVISGYRPYFTWGKKGFHNCSACPCTLQSSPVSNTKDNHWNKMKEFLTQLPCQTNLRPLVYHKLVTPGKMDVGIPPLNQNQNLLEIMFLFLKFLGRTQGSLSMSWSILKLWLFLVEAQRTSQRNLNVTNTAFLLLFPQADNHKNCCWLSQDSGPPISNLPTVSQSCFPHVVINGVTQKSPNQPINRLNEAFYTFTGLVEIHMCIQLWLFNPGPKENIKEQKICDQHLFHPPNQPKYHCHW